MKTFNWQQFLRFLVVGGLNTAFGYGLYALFVLAGLHYAWASLAGTVVGILFNFVTTGRLVFKNKDGSRIYRFFGAYALTYGFNVLGLFLLSSLGEYKAGLALLLPTALFSFFLQKRFVFAERVSTA